MASFFSLLRYSFGNEDWRTEEEALNIQPSDHVLCITASGDRPLNLLFRECQKIVCIDANSAQNHLLELKAAAMSTLDYEQYLAFLGANGCKERGKFLDCLQSKMSPEAFTFWITHKKMIEKGVLYQGSMERLTNLIAKIFALTRGRKVKRLFSMTDLEEQKKFVKNEWDSFIWRKIFNILLNPLISRILIKDPGLANIGTNIKAGTYIYERIQASLERELANKNPLLSLLLKGKVSKEGYSLYLTEPGAQVIKNRLSTLEIRTMDLLDYLDSLPGPTFDVYSLSDVSSYLSYSNFVRLLKSILRTSKPGARFCLRQFLSFYEIPKNLEIYFRRDTQLEKKLEHNDNCFVYRFLAGTISHSDVNEFSIINKKDLATIGSS